ncbi:hypothetical protein Sme01_04810 [Sphaerisporangium melleum]|uniref:Uncharacterized protein n=1 Tax=Sphaerisporangium melleum TaxID=321316 RepID=A0A917VD36_9ACTN|nr:hypothetical protein GCM10007964_02370 [Sphaerisporangium melleum]GII68005.1 hypothetical protein Sme01_04810 [Sphaerisporangium melleum]
MTLEAGERVLVHARTPDGGYVVATDRALRLPGEAALPWYRVDRAMWDQQGLVVVGTDGVRHRVELPDPGRLPEAVRERVTATILVNRHVRLGERGGVRLVARRVPGQETADWGFVFDPGLDPADPGLRAAAEQVLERLRRTLGV